MLDCEVDHKAEYLFLMEMDTTHSLRQYCWCPCVRYQSIEVHVYVHVNYPHVTRQNIKTSTSLLYEIYMHKSSI